MRTRVSIHFLLWIMMIGFLFPARLPAQSTMPPLGHVVVVAMENHSYSDVVGSASMPYFNNLISQYGLAQSFYANIHGSFPNYAMLTTGELITQAGWGLPDDFPISIDNLARELSAAGKSWKVYAETLPSPGYTGSDSGEYLKRHNPFAYMSDVLNSSSMAANIVPFSQFANDLGANTLPNFSFVVPNGVDDAEDCPGGGTSCSDSTRQSTADQWLQSNIAPLLSNPTFQKDGLLVIWWDEGNAGDNANGGGHIAVVLAGPTIKSGYKSTTFYRHEHLLRTIAEALGIGYPGASLYVQSMSEFFGQPAPQGAITGHVTNASTQAAIAGATVSYSGGSTTTDSSGSYTLSNVPAGSYSVTASASGFNSQTSPITVSSGSTATLNFQLNAGSGSGSGNSPGTLSGKVTDISSGFGAPGATVTFSGGSATTDAHGYYSFASVAPGTYSVTATHPGYFALTKSVTVASGAAATLNFAIATGGQVGGTVTNSSGAPVAGASVHITGGSISTTVNTATDSTGSYNSDWVPVGTYSVTVSAPGFASQTKTVDVSTGNVATLNFTMQ